MSRSALPLAVLAFVIGCRTTTAPSLGNVVETGKARYGRADTIDVTFSNAGDISLAYSPCHGQLEGYRQTWVAVGPAAGETVCVDVLVELGPHATRSAQIRRVGDLPPGVYRFLFDYVYRSGELLPASDRR